LSVYHRHRHAILFYTLLVTLGIAPLLAALGFSTNVLQILLAFSLLAAVLNVQGQRWRTLLILAAAVALGVYAAPTVALGRGLGNWAILLVVGVAVIATASAVRFAMTAKDVYAEHVYAALSAYLLAGFSFGVLHWAIENSWPGSFSEGGGVPTHFTLPTAIYFSFVTLATLGFGDIAPKNEVARGIVILEAVGGQLYVAAMIARLVGARLQTIATPDNR
jgi:ion channel